MKFAIISLAAALLAISVEAGAAFLPLTPHGSIIAAGGYTIDLGDADHTDPPRVWEGPIRITGPKGTACIVSEDVSIVEQPLSLVQGHLLYVTTYSGSEVKLYVVDADDCKVKWTSREFEGIPKLTASAVVLPNSRPLAIRDDGLPAK